MSWMNEVTESASRFMSAGVGRRTRRVVELQRVLATLCIAATIMMTMNASAQSNAPTQPPAAAPTPKTQKMPRYTVVLPTVYPGATIAFPPLPNFVQGTPRTAFEPGRVYVFECFSTTCGHCAEAAPILEALVHEFAPRGFEFIGVAADACEVVAPWLALPENKKLYAHSIACDPDRAAQRVLQDGTFQNLSPRVFALRDGIVLWYGHPEIAQKPFAAIAAGTWNPQSIKSDFVANALAARAKNQITSVLTQCEKTGEWPRALALLDSVVREIPDRASTFQLQKFGLMIGPAAMPTEGYAFGKALALQHPSDLVVLRTLVRSTLSGPQVAQRDLDFAFALARAADVVGKGQDARAAELLALAYFSRGDRAQAIEHQTRAIALQTTAKLRVSYETQLEMYKTNEPKPVPYTPKIPVAGSTDDATTNSR